MTTKSRASAGEGLSVRLMHEVWAVTHMFATKASAPRGGGSSGFNGGGGVLRRLGKGLGLQSGRRSTASIPV